MSHGTFEKNGVRRTAHSPADVAKLKFDGWAAVPDAEEADRAAIESAQPVVDAVEDEQPKPRGRRPQTSGDSDDE